VEPSELAAQMATVSTELLAEPNEELTVRSIVARALEIVPDAESVSLTVRSRRRRLQTLAATDDLAERADELQYRLKEGPCVDSVEQADWFRSGSVRHDPRWPSWGPRAADLGVGSLLSVLTFSGNEPRGALNIYSRHEGSFGEPDDIELAVLFAVHAANALSAARLVDGLEIAVGSRHVIGMAQGIVMERFGLSADQSFSLLRRLSSVTNTKMAQVARTIVDTREVPIAPVGSESSGEAPPRASTDLLDPTPGG
jgi:GAF domain-containing protein